MRHWQKLAHKLVVRLLARPYLLLIHFRYDSQHGSAVIDKQTNRQTPSCKDICAVGEEKITEIATRDPKVFLLKPQNDSEQENQTHNIIVGNSNCTVKMNIPKLIFWYLESIWYFYPIFGIDFNDLPALAWLFGHLLLPPTVCDLLHFAGIFALHLKPYPGEKERRRRPQWQQPRRLRQELQRQPNTFYIIYFCEHEWVPFRCNGNALRIRSVSLWFAFIRFGFSDRFGLVGFCWVGFLHPVAHPFTPFPFDFASAFAVRLSALSTGTRKWKMAIALALKPPIAPHPPPRHFPTRGYIGHCQF